MPRKLQFMYLVKSADKCSSSAKRPYLTKAFQHRQRNDISLHELTNAIETICVALGFALAF
jgi:hypothetical protein